MSRLPAALVVALALSALSESPDAAQPAPAKGARPNLLEVAHAQALDSFRRARFSEAYGRFIRLAELGHPASARYAIWMCENGTPLFATPWDCAPHELEDWRAIAAQPTRSAGSGARWAASNR
jgi:hypothetical protein